ncbi:MAG: tyrosine-type recombinase/integrase [Planctomycetota bacterium]|nr:tyrosine-type recombinase/integrase [Planctomycetota bacterium]
MAKRANGEGTISRRKDGRWQGAVTLGRAPNGKSIRKCVYGKTQQECREKMDLLRQQAGKKLDFKRGTDSLAVYLQHWLENVVKLNRAARTHEEYEMAVRLYIVPYIGHRKLAKLSAQDLESWQASLVKKGHSDHCRMRAIRVLRAALNSAIRNQVIQFNPVSAIAKPKVVSREVQPLEVDQCERLFAEAETNRLGDIVTLAVMTGLRLGELLALEWNDINLAEGVLSVRRTLVETNSGLSLKEPKSRAGRRVITLGRPAIEALRNRRRKAIEEGMDPKAIPVVFPNTIGTHQTRSGLSNYTWYVMRDAAGIGKDVRFHDLRHSHASFMIAAGIHIKVIQERLGHSTFKLTADTYSHLLQSAQADAVERVDELFRKPDEKLVAVK